MTKSATRLTVRTIRRSESEAYPRERLSAPTSGSKNDDEAPRGDRHHEALYLMAGPGQPQLHQFSRHRGL